MNHEGFGCSMFFFSIFQHRLLGRIFFSCCWALFVGNICLLLHRTIFLLLSFTLHKQQESSSLSIISLVYSLLCCIWTFPFSCRGDKSFTFSFVSLSVVRKSVLGYLFIQIYAGDLRLAFWVILYTTNVRYGCSSRRFAILNCSQYDFYYSFHSAY